MDAGISQAHGFNAIEFSQPEIKDWREFDLQAFLEMPPLPQPAVRPCTSLRFFRVVNDMPLPFANVEKALGDQLPSLASFMEDVPVPRQSSSVVMAIRIVPHHGTEFGNAWLHQQFEKVLSTLNEKLLALGAASDDHSIGPVTERQLPIAVFGFQGDMRNVRAGHIRDLDPFVLMLHQGGGLRENDHDGSVINYAMAIADRGGRGPFFPALEFMFAARRSFDAGMLAQSVLEAGTAIELLVNRTVLGIELNRQSTQDRIDNLLENTGFRNLIRDHLAPHLGISVDRHLSGADPVSNWLRIAYLLRNRVAHRGHKPSMGETVEALQLADEFIAFVAAAAEDHDEFGIQFPEVDELELHPLLDERSLAIEDESTTRLSARRAFDRGVAARHDNDIDTARAAFDEADALGSAGGAFNVAWLAMTDGDDFAAESAFRRAADRHHPVAAAYLGVGLLRDGRTDEAKAAFLRAPPTHPVAGPIAAYFLATIAADSNELQEAADLYRRASVFDDFEYAGDAAFRRGTILQELGDDGASDAYARGADLGSVEAASNLANLQRGNGDILHAARSYERALALADRATEGIVAFNYANMLDEQDRLAEATPLYERAAARGEPWSHVRLAGLAADAGRRAEAVNHLLAARSTLDPNVQQFVADMAESLNLDLDNAVEHPEA
ncbi:MAG: tetratricopeptide repeat protein [Solirubrobacteraceae bacterium]